MSSAIMMMILGFAGRAAAFTGSQRYDNSTHTTAKVLTMDRTRRSTKKILIKRVASYQS
jgi:hypothetical protein